LSVTEQRTPLTHHNFVISHNPEQTKEDHLSKKSAQVLLQNLKNVLAALHANNQKCIIGIKSHWAVSNYCVELWRDAMFT